KAVDTVNTTLHTDEASKYGSKWGAFATRDSEGNYTLLGLRDMATKSMFVQTMNLLHKNTMSDRASTETKFNEPLAEYRTEILPNVIEKYEEMSENEKAALSRMNIFFVDSTLWCIWQMYLLNHCIG
ncbi:hypothetical protein MAR_027470, partial [Mya arenaria]